MSLKFKVGQTVLCLNTELDPNKSTIKAGLIEKIISRDEIKLYGDKYPRYSAFCYPDSIETMAFLQDGINLAIKHKQENDAYIKRTYEYNNELVRKGMK